MMEGKLRLLPLWFIVFSGLVVFWQPGYFMTDEVAQTVALTELGEWDLEVDSDQPDGYLAFREWFWHPSVPKEPGLSMPPVGSTMINVLALPLLLLLRVLYETLGFHLALAVVSAPIVAGGAWTLMKTLDKPAKTRRIQVTAGIALLVLIGPFIRRFAWPDGKFFDIFSQESFPASPFLELAALQLVAMAAGALAAVFFFDLVRRHFSLRTALVAAGLLLCATPVWFWSLNSKYHAMSLALAMMAIWCYRDGAESPPLRTFAAFSLAGLAVWNQMPLGLLFLASLGAAHYYGVVTRDMDARWAWLGVFALFLGGLWAVHLEGAVRYLPALVALGAVGLLAWGYHKAKWRDLGRMGAAAAGLGLGIVPLLWQRAIENQLRVGSQYFPQSPQGRVDGQVGEAAGAFSGAVLAETDSGMLSHHVFTDPGGVLDALWQSLFFAVWGDRPAVPVSILGSAPFVVLAFFALFRRKHRERIPKVLVFWGAILAALMFLVMGQLLLDVGAGYDMRHSLMLWPFLVLLALPLLEETMDSLGTKLFLKRAGYGAAGIVALTLFITFIGHLDGTFTRPTNPDGDPVYLPRLLGSIFAFVLIAAAAGFSYIHPKWRDGVKADAFRVWDKMVCWGISFGAALVLIFKMGPENPPIATVGSPYVIWVVDLVGRVLERTMYWFPS